MEKYCNMNGENEEEEYCDNVKNYGFALFVYTYRYMDRYKWPHWIRCRFITQTLPTLTHTDTHTYTFHSTHIRLRQRVYSHSVLHNVR